MTVVQSERPFNTTTFGKQKEGRFQKYIRKAYSENTQISLDSGWRAFRKYLIKTGRTLNFHSHSYTPEELVADFLVSLHEEGKSYSTVESRFYSVMIMFKRRGIVINRNLESLRDVVKGIRRNSVGKKGQDPLSTASIIRMLSVTEDTLKGHRDRAILLLGFATACRRVELATIDVDHLMFVEGGMRLLVPRSKTDKSNEGRIIDIPRLDDKTNCPVVAVEEYIREASITSGPLFRGCFGKHVIGDKRLLPISISVVIKKLAKQAGIRGKISAHSLRSGHVSEAFKNGSHAITIARQTGHKSLNTLQQYVRVTEEFRVNSVLSLGL